MIDSVTLKHACREPQSQYFTNLLAQQVICLPIIQNLVTVCKVKSPSQHTVVPVVPLQEIALCFFAKKNIEVAYPVSSSDN